jgi:alpha-L-rhamnosidase
MNNTFTPSSLRPISLRCEYRADPLGIDVPAPRLFWKLDSDKRGARQSAYQIRAAHTPEALASETGSFWNSGKVVSAQSVHISYGGPELTSGQRVYWAVRVWDEGDQASAWSDPAFWQMGLLTPEDWSAEWISLPPARPHIDLSPAPFLRREFAVSKAVARATISVTALGVYTLRLNGQAVSADHFAPGWADYRKRVPYQTYDVTSLVREGANALGAMLGDGWYAGYIGFENKRANYGPYPKLRAQLTLEYADGTKETVGTDSAWRGTLGGPILFSDMLMGENYDARLEMPDWDTPSFDASGWAAVRVEAALVDVPLVAQIDPPVRLTEELPARSVTQPTPGSHLFDLGQNMVGWVRLKLEGAAGTVVQLRFGEILQPDGSLYVANLRAAKATDTYIMKGGGEETFEPHFTFHGFRYVEVTGYPGEPSLDAVTGCVLHSDTPKTGTFECDNALVNQLVQNIDWGQRGNFLSIPTDCPQRDERLGWMGDAQIFVRTAAGNRDVAAFFTKWMDDVVDAQSPEGGFPDVAPRLVDLSDGAPAWGDAGVIVPWTIYQVYGDTALLEKNYDAMASWIEYLHSVNPDHLWTKRRNNDFGDWLSIAADTDKSVLATAYFAYDTSLMAQIASVLGRPEDAAKYTALFGEIKAAFNQAYVSEDGRIQGDTQTAYVLALRFGLLPDALRPVAAQHLVADIEAKNWHLSTGFVGVGYLCPVLTDVGQADVAYRLLLNETFPSWGYSIKQGATTIWERWDGWTEEKGFQDVGMNSFNHYSLGSVGEWLQRYVAGIDTDSNAPGFAKISLRPHPSRRLPSVRASFDSLHGSIGSAYAWEGDTLKWRVTVPANTTALISIPTADAASVREGDLPAAQAEGLRFVEYGEGRAVYEAGAGEYALTAELTA